MNFYNILRQNGINDRAINSKRWKPDEAFINEIDKTVYIIEKFQHTSSSVDENSQHSHSKSENIDGF